MTTRTKIIIGVVAAIIVIGLGIVLYRPGPAEAPVLPSENPTATTTDAEEQPAAGGKRPLPPEPAIFFPEGAVKLDDYAYTYEGAAYFRSLTGKEPLPVLNAKAATFERLTEFASYSTEQIMADCGAAGMYAFYGDGTSLYFYQVWRAPEFRSSEVRIMAGSDSDGFEKTGTHSFTDGVDTFTLGYQKATTTCAYTLIKK